VDLDTSGINVTLVKNGGVDGFYVSQRGRYLSAVVSSILLPTLRFDARFPFVLFLYGFGFHSMYKYELFHPPRESSFMDSSSSSAAARFTRSIASSCFLSASCSSSTVTKKNVPAKSEINDISTVSYFKQSSQQKALFNPDLAKEILKYIELSMDGGVDSTESDESDGTDESGAEDDNNNDGESVSDDYEDTSSSEYDDDDDDEDDDEIDDENDRNEGNGGILDNTMDHD
jgi:hypothetical protein